MGIHDHPAGVDAGERPQALVRLYLLGRFEVVREDAPIPAHAWRRRRPADLLRIVALAPGREIGRDEAIASLWPDKDPSSGANNLHRALYDLRQVLGGRWVDVDRGRIRMRPDVWLDVDAFEDAVAEGGRTAFARAVALYRGDLAPDDHDSAWLRPRRAALRARFVEAALPLARETAADGDTHRSIPLLRRVLEVDPACEEAHRLLMRLLAEGGRRAEALRQYDACERAMRADGLGPSDDARALRAAIQRGEVGPAHAPVLDGARRASRRLLGTTEPAPVRGRGSTLLLVEALLERGAGTLVLLGERGVGKTRLAVEGARLAEARGAAVVCGVGGTAPGVPYALFQDALRAEARADPATQDPFAEGPLAARAAGEGVRRALFDGVERALRAVADGRPLYLLLDDLHLADESSLNLLHLLARDAEGLRLVTVATCDEAAIRAGTPIQMALAHLDCGRLGRGVRLNRLALASTREQVRDLLEGPADDAAVSQIYRLTDGSPLLVEEVVRCLREAPAGMPADGAAAIRGRAARLGRRAETLLAAAAVAGVRFDLELVARVSGLDPEEASGALEGCLAARLLDEDGSDHQFHNALVRDTIYEGIPPARRAELHAAVADELEARSTQLEPASETIAHHRRRAGQDERALRHLVAAGHRAAERAGLREALAFYEEALALPTRAGADGPSRGETLEASGRVQLGLGELSGAARAFAEAARLLDPSGRRSDPSHRARCHHLAALSLSAGGHLVAAHAEIDEGLLRAGEAGGEGGAALLLLRARLLWHQGRHGESLAAAEACAAAAERALDADLAGRGRDLAALARAASGDAPPGPEEPGPERTPRHAEPEHPLDVHLILWERDLLGDGDCCAFVTRLAAIHADRARLRDARGALAVGRYGEGVAALAGGRFDVAEAALRAALLGHRLAPGSALGEALALDRLAALLTARGRLDEALALVDEGIVVAERSSLRRHALTRLHVTEARNRLAAGAARAAEDAIREASEAAARHGECVVCDAAFRPEAVRVLLARGRLEDAAQEAAAFEEIARRRGGAVLGALARATRARVLAGEGRVAEALDGLAAARAALAAAGHRWEAARLARVDSRLRPGEAPDEVRSLEALVLWDGDA